MESHGVYIKPEEEERLSKLSEERFIDALIARLPSQNREQFEHFFLQLSLIASTTSRLRSALEMGKPEAMEEVLDAADDVGITPYILKMALVQAGKEVRELEKDHEAWMGGASGKMSPLLSCAQEAMMYKKQLAAANAELGGYRSSANEKSKKVLMGLMSGQKDALMHTSFNAWADITKHTKLENEIRVEYEERIFKAEKELMDYTEAQMTNVRKVLSRKAGEKDKELIQLCFDAIGGEIVARKRKAELDEKMAEAEAKLKSFSDSQIANTKKVMTRMSAGNDATLTNMCFQEWVKFCEDYKKNLEMEEAVKAAEKKVAEFMKKQGDSAKGVLGRMTAGNDTGLLSMTMKAWAETIKEEKNAREMQEKLDAAADKFSGFNSRTKGTAMSAMCRAAETMDRQCLILVFAPWKKEARCERMKRYGKEKNQKKKEQVNNVKGLFKNFAAELDSGLKQGTPRIEIKKKAPPPPSEPS
eukprot:gnl/TRDRNA2_/TRDRNA2_175914_c1_seq3.p1 gnl/TRDRNA2_/TRDRNA2_175914_c1~~gnl/TRDRNA2_/TRDRNA2_175914_c1_seq3.p1  ORF type:complete len:473 (-),score=162.43 gnl/TRDRNA2_/TRDRNA2_175914_c1_seq3:622-2040(-)